MINLSSVQIFEKRKFSLSENNNHLVLDSLCIIDPDMQIKEIYEYLIEDKRYDIAMNEDSQFIMCIYTYDHHHKLKKFYQCIIDYEGNIIKELANDILQ